MKRTLDPQLVARARELYRGGASTEEAARACGIARSSFYEYVTGEDKAAHDDVLKARRAAPEPTMIPEPAPHATLPPGKHERDEPSLPLSFPQSYEPFEIDTPGWWLVLCDCHVPFHDRSTIEAAVAAARSRGAVGVLLNGDLLDSHEISDHDRDPRAPRYVEEIALGRQFLAWLRGRFPRGRLVYKSGNHEERLDRYLIRRAPALFGLEGVNLPSLLHLSEYGVEWVADKRVVRLGKLNVVHGHEYPGGVSSPVNPARGLYLKARSVAMCGHHHRTSEHHAKDIRQRSEAAWSVGCACWLSPGWRPLNDWNLGFALTEVSTGGEFAVENRRVCDGKVM